MTFTANSIRTIKKELIWDEFLVERLGNNGSGAQFLVSTFDQGAVFTGKADAVANWLNRHYDLKDDE